MEIFCVKVWQTRTFWLVGCNTESKSALACLALATRSVATTNRTYTYFASCNVLLSYRNYPMFSKHSLTSSAISAEPNFSETRPATERLQ